MSVLARALKYAITGAVIGGLAAWFMFGGAGYHPASGNYGWGPFMAPVFAVIGAVVGLLNFALVSIWLGARGKIIDAVNSPADPRAFVHSAEWDNQANWTAGMIYKSRVDRRIFVPQKWGGWFTINFGQPLGLALGVVLLVALVIAIISIFSR